MPTRKQRRRRAKSQRHEYEIVYLDDEGNEVEVVPEEAPVRREREGKRDDTRKNAKQSGRGRTLDPPTWHRSFKRTLIMAPFFFIFLYVLQRDVASAAIVSLFYAAIFVPFSYGIDKLTYRTQMKRLERR
jgi:hypothetical protein